VQNGLNEVNLKTLKIEGLYKWRNPAATTKFTAFLVVGFLIMVYIPFRFIFPLIILDFFTDKWQKDGSQMDKLLMEAGLPDKMPEID